MEQHGERVIAGPAIVVLDEASMLDLGLLERTLDRAIERGASMLAIDDRAQLQAVMAGATYDIGYDVVRRHGCDCELAIQRQLLEEKAREASVIDKTLDEDERVRQSIVLAVESLYGKYTNWNKYFLHCSNSQLLSKFIEIPLRTN